MDTIIQFLSAIGRADNAIHIRCLKPRNLPLSEAKARGMTYFSKEKKEDRFKAINGVLNPETGEFIEIRGDKKRQTYKDGLGYLQTLNKQGFGIYFVVNPGGSKSAEISHGMSLFHESDKQSLDEQRATVDRISKEFGKPTAIVQTRRSLHSYWRCSEPIPSERFGEFQRRWAQYSGCDDNSLADLAQMMRLPGFDHVHWNDAELEFQPIELIQHSDASYSLAKFDETLPELEVAQWVHNPSGDGAMLNYAPYLEGYNPNGRDGWITAKCPVHGGESDNSLHIHLADGGFICHSGCEPGAVFQAARATAIAKGYRVVPKADDSEVEEGLSLINATYVQKQLLFGNEILDPIRYVADRHNVGYEAYVTSLLPIAAAQLNTGICLELNPATNFVVPPIIWAGLVGSSGVKKSPIIKDVMAPLLHLQQLAEEEYKTLQESYEQDIDAWNSKKKDERQGQDKPVQPVPKDHYLSDFTMEALAQVLSQQPEKGLTVWIDEISRFFSAMDAYRGGKGGDRQNWLSLYDAIQFKTNRKFAGRAFAARTNVNIVGGIQPSILEKILNSDESSEDGLWPRFVWVRVPLTISPGIVQGEKRSNLREVLSTVYTRLQDLPGQTYSLSRDAIDVWNQWHLEIEHAVFTEPSPLLRTLYPKMREKAARIALICHCVNNPFPDSQISANTLENAISFTKWLIAESKLLYAEMGICDTAETAKYLKAVSHFKNWEAIKPRDLSRWGSSEKRMTSDESRKFMSELVTRGYAIDNGEPSSSSKYFITIKRHFGDKSPVILDRYGFSLSPPLVTTLPNNAQNTDEHYFLAIGDKSENLVTTGDNFGENDFEPENDLSLKKDLPGSDPTCHQSCHQDVTSQNTDEHYISADLSPMSPLVTRDGDSQNQESEKVSGDLSPKSPDIESIEKYDPRSALTYSPGRVDVDLDKLSLDYQPSVPVPDWKPSKQLKPYSELSKLYLDIETSGLNPESDRVLMVGLMDDHGKKTILVDPDEKAILTELASMLSTNKSDVLIGHNLVNFDLPFIIARCKKLNRGCPFQFGDKEKRITASSFHGKPITFTPVRWKGVQILDTFQQVCIWDKQAAKLDGYGLKNSVIALELRSDRRLELSYEEIQNCWKTGDISTLQQYLEFDLEDTKLLGDFLLPVVYFQLMYVPGISFQVLAVASPALKAQLIHQSLIPSQPEPDEPMSYEGGGVDLLSPGLHQNVAKIDVSSLYPSVMLRYGLCSKKDTNNAFLGVLQFMRDERLRLKALAKAGDGDAKFQEGALKILINGSYGFLGTGGYSFNDYGAASLVTGYGRKILNRMVEAISSCDATVIEIDTDGVLFSHDDPETVYELVQGVLPTGINIELEMRDCGLYVPKAKNYVIVHPEGNTTVKGHYRKRDRYQLEKTFTIEFLKRHFTESPEAAMVYYQTVRQSLIDGEVPLQDLTVTMKIPENAKDLLRLGKPGDRVSFWYAEEKRFHKVSGKQLNSAPLKTNTEPVWTDWYVKRLDAVYSEITGQSVQLDDVQQLSILGDLRGAA